MFTKGFHQYFKFEITAFHRKTLKSCFRDESSRVIRYNELRDIFKMEGK